MNKVELNLHMISDSSGETLVTVARASTVQFNNVLTKEYVWSLVNDKIQIEKIIQKISASHNAFVMYTIVDDNLREYLKHQCQKLKVPCIPVLSRVIREISSYLGVKPHASPQHYEVLSDDYYSRVDAMNYVLSHDDGQNIWDIDDADIVLIGASRTSKSPTSIYLAYHGYKVSNIPFVSGITLPLENINSKLVVGLTIDPERLIEIRKNRLKGMGNSSNINYISLKSVTREILSANELFRHHRWPVIDVTKISVEEIAAKIIQYYHTNAKNCLTR